MRGFMIFIGFLSLVASQTLAQELTEIEKLGQKLFTDINLSLNRNQSCESCHSLSPVRVPVQLPSGRFEVRFAPAASLADPTNVQSGVAVSSGSKQRALGSLNAPTASYAALSPPFRWNGKRFLGGQFWNGRARDLVEQAKGPFLNPVEMAMPDQWSVIERLRERNLYRKLFRELFEIKLNELVPGTPEVSAAYDAMASAIGAFERTSTFNRFDSKFDFVAAGLTSFTPEEQRGEDLFNGAALCSKCHTTSGIDGDGTPAAFSDFRYENVGMPANPQIPGNPGPDPGLAGNPHLEAARGEPSPLQEVEGRHKTVSLRNIELTPPYMHNGVLKTLEEVVHYYNTRDVLSECTDPSNASNPGFGISCWTRGEYHETRNSADMGNLGLSEQDEEDLVSFMKTLTDNYPKWGNSYGRKDPNVPRGTPSPFADFEIPDYSTADTPDDPLPPIVNGPATQTLFGASKDATIFRDKPDGTISSGRMRVGRNQRGSVRRGLIAFDLSAIPAGALITAVELHMVVSDYHESGVAIRMHRLEADWGEGSTTGSGSGGGGGQPRTAMANEVTWSHRLHGSESWNSPGGDFVSTASATTRADGSATWKGPGLRDDVQFWVNNPGSNFGWMLIGNETRAQSVQTFFSRESLDSLAPRLVVSYTE